MKTNPYLVALALVPVALLVVAFFGGLVGAPAVAAWCVAAAVPMVGLALLAAAIDWRLAAR